MHQISLRGYLASLLFVLFSCSWAGNVCAQEGQFARTPPMGWEGWSYFTRSITTDATVRSEARAMVETGMKDAGYEYVIIGEGWEGQRAADGSIRLTAEFPDMKALSDYIHGLGLKFGIYSSPGPYTCGGYTGGYQHEIQDAKTFAAWGVDYLKYDYCSAGVVYPPDQMPSAYSKMFQAIRNTGKPIVFSIYEYDPNRVWRWGASVGGNLWLTADEIAPARYEAYMRMASIGFEQNGLEKYAGPGHWNNPGMIEVGNGRLTPTEERLQMTLWSILSAPLITGNDLRNMSEQTKSTLTNSEVIAVDQDPEGIQGHRVEEEGQLEVWIKPLSDGSKAVGLFNREEGDAVVEVKFDDIGIQGGASVRDLWQHKDLGIYHRAFSANVPQHGAVLVKIKAQ